MNKRRFHGLGISTESHEEPIIIGAEQDLITVKDALSSINEGKDEVDDTQLAVDELTEAKESLEAMTLAVRQQIRDGGMSPTVAQTQQAVAIRVLGRIGIDGNRYTISHESFAHDPIGVSLEAERSLKEAVTEILKRIWAALAKALEAIKNYIKQFKVVGKSLKTKAEALKKTVEALATESVDKKFDANGTGQHFHVDGSFDGNVESALRKILAEGNALSKYTIKTKQGVDAIVAQVAAGKYTKGGYEKEFKAAADSLPEGHLPGGYELKKDGLKVTLSKGGEYKGDANELAVPAKATLSKICTEVVALATFVETYSKELEVAEQDLERMMKGVEKDAGSLKEGDDTRGDAIKQAGEDMSAIVSVVRGCGPDFIRYVSVSGKEALNFVNKAVAQYK